MADDSLDDPAGAKPAASKDKQHRQRNDEQAELLRQAFERWRHATYIEEALRRAEREREADESDRSRARLNS